MIDRTVSEIILVHHVYDLHYRLLIMGGVAIDFHIEDMTSTGKLVVRGFYLCFVSWRAMIVDGDMVGVGIIILVGHSFDASESFAVYLGEFSGKPFGRRGRTE